MWECGLKHCPGYHRYSETIVTPYVGVWIETDFHIEETVKASSLLMWECGLKPY